MSVQSEQALERQLIAQLVSFGYQHANINNEYELVKNLKIQLEKHNNIIFSENEFKQVLNWLNKGNIFQKAEILREKCAITLDDGTDKQDVEFINQVSWCKNQFQVANQITVAGKYTNRYDVTILINGLPLVHIELKRRGIELQQAFRQIERYKLHSFGENYKLYCYVQIFIISNGVNTKYYAHNNNKPYNNFKQTFYWTDKENNRISDLHKFATEFLQPCQISKMIVKYTALNYTNKCLMVLRPYQYYAVETIIDRVENNPKKNGYIWHTTGSGKTLTAFTVSKILAKLNSEKVYKIVFVVDRRDLDYQTIKEFNHYINKQSHDNIDIGDIKNTKQLVDKFSSKQLVDKLIVTTIQKLYKALTSATYSQKMSDIRNERIIFIFDECHRSQFGKFNSQIKNHFINHQYFGFTGTPILNENSKKKNDVTQLTKDIFDDRLHTYVINNAIHDDNVLKFIVEYVGKYTHKDDRYNEIRIDDIAVNHDDNNYDNSNFQSNDIKKVASINIKELLESEHRINKIVDYIVKHHDIKTSNRTFNAILCVANIKPVLFKYYEAFKKYNDNISDKSKKIKIATIFSYSSEEQDINAQVDNRSGEITDDSTRSRLDQYIADYNQQYQTTFSTKSKDGRYDYFKNIAKRIKDHDKYRTSGQHDQCIDILLVVDMFLTGFDSKYLNTIYVDKPLKQHGLIQAFSRTNRTLDNRKQYGSVLCFRNLKDAADEAVRIFSDPNAKEDVVSQVIVKPYSQLLIEINTKIKQLKHIVPNISNIDELMNESEQLKFIKNFREIMRLKNVLESHVDFKFSNLNITEQEYNDYSSKYLDLRDQAKQLKTQGDKESILDDVDYETELFHRDNINVEYIINLLQTQFSDNNAEINIKLKTDIMNKVNASVILHNKKDLIEKFINDVMNNIGNLKDCNMNELYEQFMNKEREHAKAELCREYHNYNLTADTIEELKKYYEQCEYEDKTIRPREIVTDILKIKIGGDKLKLSQLKLFAGTIIEQIKKFIEKFN